MTVLEQYRRLESLGLWRDGPEDQRREVVVSLGEATLVVSTPSETALTHWSLPAVERLNPGRTPALYAPGAEATERLEIDDPDMIAAIEAVRDAIDRGRPHPGRLRWMIGAAAALAILAGAVFWLPGALTRQTVLLLPEAKRVEIGEALLSEIGRLAGPPCTAPRARVALARLSTRVLGAPAPRVLLIPAAIPDTISLPGQFILASAALVEDHESPDVLAGYLLAEDVRRDARDPMLTLLSDAGLMATFRLLTTGDLPEGALHDHAVTSSAGQRGRPGRGAGRTLCRGAPVDRGLCLCAGRVGRKRPDPDRGRPDARTAAREPLISDEDWLSLQNMCAGG
jgi:hypothetical protein